MIIVWGLFFCIHDGGSMITDFSTKEGCVNAKDLSSDKDINFKFYDRSIHRESKVKNEFKRSK